MSYCMHFSFFLFFSVSRHIAGHTIFVSHFPRFSVFSPKYRSYTMYFSYFIVCTASRHIPGPRVCVSHFFTFFSVSCHIPFPTVCVSHFAFFKIFLSVFHLLQFVFLIFYIFQVSRHFPGPTGKYFFTNFSVSRYIPGPPR